MIDKTKEKEVLGITRGIITKIEGNYIMYIKPDDAEKEIRYVTTARECSNFTVGQRVVLEDYSYFRPANYDDVQEYTSLSLPIQPGERIMDHDTAVYDELTYDEQNQTANNL